MMSDTVLEIVAKEAVQMDGIRPYLGVVARNPLLSPLNQALLYFQNPKSGLVCGRTAWEAMGREVRADAVPVTLYVPEIVIGGDGVRADYKVVSVFGEEVTVDRGNGEGHESSGRVREDFSRSPGMTGDFDLVGRILETMGATTEMIEAEVLADRFSHGMYDRERKVFFLEKGSSRETQMRTVAELFVEEMARQREVGDKALILAVKDAVFQRYGVEAEIMNALYAGLDRYGMGEKVGFLVALGRLVMEVVQGIEGRCLSFDETAFVNGMFDTDDKDELVLRCMQGAGNAEDEMLSEELRLFGEKLLYMDGVCVKRLCRMREERRVFSYPAVRF